MQKHIIIKLLAGSTLALSAAAFAAPSGSSGSSGSAGLGIDTGLGGSISSVIPSISVPGATHRKQGMGGPIQGVADLNAKKQDSKGK